jgi:ABC-2 type transport system permease protein
MRDFAHQLRFEQILYWRSREAAFFTFALPLVFYVLLGSAYGSDRISGIKGSRYLLAGMVGYGVVATAFAGLAITIVIRREQGVLKRIRSTPLSPSTYISAVLSSTLAVFALEVLALIALAAALFGVGRPARIGSLVVVIVLGALCFAALGLALTTAVRSAEGSSAVVNAIYLPVAFISGTFFSTHSMPSFLRAIAEVLPLTWYIKIVRDVMLHGGQAWSHPEWVAIVLGWGAAGAVIALRRFRWEPHGA